MNFSKAIFRFVIIFILTLSFSNISNSVEKNYYKDLITDWSRIFPDSNRNAAGPKFFKHIIDKDINYEDFIEYNKLYCAVSGSLIDPNSGNINLKTASRSFLFLQLKIPATKKIFQIGLIKIIFVLERK